jgi:hypothetical protein
VAGKQEPLPDDVCAEARHHIGQPIERVRMPRAVLGVSVQRQVGQHHPEAGGQRRHDRLPLAVREPERVEQHERRAGARLTVGDARAVVVVVEPQPHRKLRNA